MVYLDNIFIFYKNTKEPVKHVCHILGLLGDANLKLKI